MGVGEGESKLLLSRDARSYFERRFRLGNASNGLFLGRFGACSFILWLESKHVWVLEIQ
jgi:hypothetical protein